MNLSIRRLKALRVRILESPHGGRRFLSLLGGLLLPANGPAHAQISQITDSTGDGMGHVLDGGFGVATDGSGNVFVAGRSSTAMPSRSRPPAPRSRSR